MNEQKTNYTIPVAIIIAGLIIGYAVYSRPSVKPETADEVKKTKESSETKSFSAQEAQSLLSVKPNDYVLGDPSVSIAIVEFGDYQCPFCARFFNTTEKEIKEKYVKTGKAKFIWRDFAFLGQESLDAAQAARCAGDQGEFWTLHDYLFEKQKGENLGAFSIEKLKGFAADLKLQPEEFSTCLDSKKYLSAVEEETRLAKSLGINGTPTTFINGKSIPGAVPFSVFEEEIKKILGE